MITSKDTPDAGRSIRLELERELISAGAWQENAVDRVLEQHGASITTEHGKVSGVKDAILAYRDKNPEGFCKLGPLASNEKLPPMQRFANAYRDCVKFRDKQRALTAAQSRGMLRVRKEAS